MRTGKTYLTPGNNSVTPAVAASSRQIPVTIPAATLLNGQPVPAEFVITQSGNFFYVITTSAPLTLQPVRAGAVGAANIFSTAQGQPVSGGFDTLTVKNFSLFPIVALIWVGFDSFINDQLTLLNSSYGQACYPTYAVPNTLPHVAIPDLSGQTFLDSNGKKWGALSRVTILVFNLDPAAVLLLQGIAALVPGNGSIGAIFPLTPIRFDISGDYRINASNLLVSEIYNAIPL